MSTPIIQTDSVATAGVGSSGPRRVRWAAVLLFVVIAYGLAWAIASPLWFSGGLAPGGKINPLLFPLGVAVMATPAIAALIVTRFVLKPTRMARYLGLVPLRPWRRTLGYSALGLVIPWVIGIAALLVASATGVVTLHPGPDTAGILLSIPVASVLTAIAAFGEELGWRGFLLPTLRPLGTWPALLISGAIWGPWHAPLILLGYNYGLYDIRGVILMTITTTIAGVLFGWFRMRTGLVYPSSFAHGSLNGSAGSFVAAFLPAGAASIVPTSLGWVGWLVTAILIAGLVLGRTYHWATDRRRSTAALTATDEPAVS
jgi:membrane protease YdiL (CAAX protease family)